MIGQPIHSDRLTIRLVAGVWCCFCFFLVQAYCTTLIAHLMSPNHKMIVNSVYDIASTPGVSLTIDRGLAMDVLLQVKISYCISLYIKLLTPFL